MPETKIHPESGKGKGPGKKPLFSEKALKKLPEKVVRTPEMRFSDALVKEVKEQGLTNTRFLTKALMFANLAHVAYSDDCSAYFARLGFGNYRFYNVEGAQGHSACNGTELILTFRGTEPSQMNDVLADANMISEPHGEGFVHAGFKNECNKLLPGVKQYLAEFPGRSLGRRDSRRRVTLLELLENNNTNVMTSITL